MYHLRQYKSITIDPVRVLWIEAHEFIEQDVGTWCHAHRRPGMAGISFKSGINLFFTS